MAMIKFDDGRGEMHGNEDELIVGVTVILHNIYDLIVKNHGENEANEVFANIGRVAAVDWEKFIKGEDVELIPGTTVVVKGYRTEDASTEKEVVG